MQNTHHRLVRLETQPLTPETFAPFGALIVPSAYGKHFGPDDAQLDLSCGQPRLYIMRSPFHGMEFTRITRHQQVTQCLGARDDRDWFIAVAPPDDARAEPDPDTLRAFHIPGDTAIKLHRGTWHAGPFFTWKWIDFYNLEMVDTNQVDSEAVDFGTSHGVTYALGPADQ
jgi:ureidoglycolate hydrolase